MTLFDIDLQAVLKGIQFLLGIQLIVVAGILLAMKSTGPKKFLAMLCLIHGLWFFKHAFSGIWENNFLLFLLIGPGKPIFVGSILLFYFKTISGNLERKYIYRHLMVPASYYVMLILSGFLFRDQFSTDVSLKLSILYSGIVLLIFWYYFLITKKEIHQNVRKIIIPKAYKKTLYLFNSLYFFL